MKIKRKSNGKIVSKKIIKIMHFVVLGFLALLILISFPFYVEWCGVKDSYFQTFVSVYAAILGGGLTLAGVAWTIQHTNKVRQDDMKNAAKPLFGLLNGMNIDVAKANEHVYCFSTHIKEIEQRSFVGNFINSDKNCFILKKVIMAGKEYMTDSQYMITKEECFQIRIFEDESFDDDCKITLYVEDEIGNEWEYTLIKSGMLIVSMTQNQKIRNNFRDK